MSNLDSLTEQASFRLLPEVKWHEVSWLENQSMHLSTAVQNHRKRFRQIVEQFDSDTCTVVQAQEQLAEIAEEAVQISLRFGLLALRKRIREEEVHAIFGMRQLPIELTVVATGGLANRQLLPNSSLELAFLSPLPPRSRLQSNSGLVTQRHSQGEFLGLALTFDELERVVVRAMEILTDKDCFGYSVRVYLRESSWVAWESNSATAKLPGLLIQNPRSWYRKLELLGRAMDRLRIAKQRLLMSDGANELEIRDTAEMFSYKQYLTVHESEEFGALFRSLVYSSDAAMAGWRNWDSLQSQLEIDRVSKDSEGGGVSPLLTVYKCLWGELSFLLSYLQLRFGWRVKNIRSADFTTALRLLHEAGCIQSEEREILQKAIAVLEPAAFSVEVLEALKGGTIAGQNPLSKALKLLSFDEEKVQQLASLANDWRRFAEQVGGLDKFLALAGSERPSLEPSIADAILVPELWPNRLVKYLGSLGFKNSEHVATTLKELEKEEVSILSDARCRFYFSKIAAALLDRIAQTPNPNATLELLISTTKSLGGKGILWQLFGDNEACLDLYVRLCGSSPYLTSILASNPGMIDELLDSLMLSNLPSSSQMEAVWNELNRGAALAKHTGAEELLVAFKNLMHLNIGVREILGHSSIVETHEALTNVSDLCLQQIVDSTYDALVRKHGVPHVSQASMCPFSIVSFGKYGGREPNYHSDMTLLCLYQGDGRTRIGSNANSKDGLSNNEFYQLLAQRVGQQLNRLNRTGKLYDAKFWNLPDSPHAPLAWNVDLLRDFFQKNRMSSSHKLEFCKARVVYGTPTFAAYSYSVLQSLLSQYQWTQTDTTALLDHRSRLEATASSQNIKRGVGGTMDIELLAQSLTVAYSLNVNAWEPPSTFNLLSRLAENSVIEPKHAAALKMNYDFLRSVESGLRLMNTSARHDLPTQESDLERICYILRISHSQELVDKVARTRQCNRELFERYIRNLPKKICS